MDLDAQQDNTLTHADEDRDWGNASKHQGMSEIAGKPRGAGEKGWKRLSFNARKGTKPADPLILDFQPPDLRDNTFLLFKQLGLGCFITAAREH